MNNEQYATKQPLKKSEKKFKKHLEMNENEDTTIQNLWDIAEAVPRGKFIFIQAYLRKQEKSQISNWTLHLMEF